ncbi:hypothetical protein [Cryptosporangium phraense]|uniref:Uncharacterized protein n=1 Tax=Cryptosporangium phraense TaxID=2593070 RepID=A0A545AUP6_9ACTN|nr:hypothetical protein [Cryptosporangium phraense]TQS45042.1 hypothetical protein FL583_11115 [Cryptosporangium phraense]
MTESPESREDIESEPVQQKEVIMVCVETAPHRIPVRPAIVVIILLILISVSLPANNATAAALAAGASWAALLWESVLKLWDGPRHDHHRALTWR